MIFLFIWEKVLLHHKHHAFVEVHCALVFLVSAMEEAQGIGFILSQVMLDKSLPFIYTLFPICKTKELLLLISFLEDLENYNHMKEELSFIIT